MNFLKKINDTFSFIVNVHIPNPVYMQQVDCSKYTHIHTQKSSIFRFSEYAYCRMTTLMKIFDYKVL